MKKILWIVFLVGAINFALASPTTPESEETTELDSTTPPPLEDYCIGECPDTDPPLSAYLPNQYCNAFCQCVHGEPRALECPSGLQYNAELKVCDWPESANCTGIGGIVSLPS